MRIFTRFSFRVLSASAFLLFATNMMAQVTYYSKASATDFSDPASWGTGTDGSGASPTSLSSADNYIVANNAIMSLSTSATVRNLTINSGSLTNTGSLTVSLPSGKNATFTMNGGTFTMSSGTFTMNGNINIVGTTANFAQSGGDIVLDGNEGGNATLSVASGVNLFSSASSNMTFSGGTFTIVDPHATSSGAVLYYTHGTNNVNCSPNHTFKFGNGVSTDASLHTSGFSVNTWVSSGRFAFGNIIFDNPGAFTNRWFTSVYAYGILGNLTVNAGEFRVAITTYLAGNLANSGTLSTSSVLYFGKYDNGVISPSTQTQVVSGSGTFRNTISTSATASSANFTSVTFNNASAGGVQFSGLNTLLCTTGVTNTGTTSSTTNFTNGVVHTGEDTYIMGASATAVGSLTYTAGGFGSGSTCSRWQTTTGTGTTLAASTTPTPGAGTFPFVSGNPTNAMLPRHFHRSTAAFTAAGRLTVKFNDGSGVNDLVTPVTESGYTANKSTAANWLVSSGNGLAGTVTTGTICVQGAGCYATTAANSRLLIGNALVGTHVAGTTQPAVFRTGVALAGYSGTIRLGVSSADLAMSSTKSGAWEDPTVWSSGSVPSCTDVVGVLGGHTVTVSGTTTGNCKDLVVAGGVLAVTGGSLTVGCSNKNNALTASSGLLNVSGGTLTVNGRMDFAAGTAFTQTGGDIIVDGNSGTAGTSVATGSSLININTNAVTWTGGKLTIPNTHFAIAAAADRVLTYSPTATPYPDVTNGHTIQFGTGAVLASTKGFECSIATRLPFGNVIVNAIGANNFVNVTTASSVVHGDLTITAGDFRTASTTTVVGGNIVNNGTLTTLGTLAFAKVERTGMSTPTQVAATTPQSVSGTGVFRNSATTSTANYTSITVNNTSATGVTFADANSLLNGANTGTVSGTLTFTNGLVSTGANSFILGISAASTGTLSHTAGGFTSGSTFARWYGTSASVTTVTAGGVPTLGSSIGFPFSKVLTASPLSLKNRAAYVQQASSATTGGRVSVTYNENAGGTSVANIVDGAYTVQTRSNDSWAIATTGISGAPTYNVGLSAQDLYNASNGNSRITLAAAAVTGAHQNGTIFPHAQRAGMPLADLTNTFHIGANDGDIPHLSIASGDWKFPTTWNKGTVPGCNDVVVIGTGTTVDVSDVSASKNLTVQTGGTLNVGAALIVGCTDNNNSLTLNGTLNINASANLVVNGSVTANAGSTWNQSGGDMKVDPNSGTAATSATSHTVSMFSQNVNWTGGTLTLVDPPAVAAMDAIFFSHGLGNVNAGAGHTLQLGDGVSTTAGADATYGFRLNTYPSSSRINFGSLFVNGAGGTNRHVSQSWTTGIAGTLTISASSELRQTTSLYLAGDAINNGTWINTSGLYLGKYIGTTPSNNDVPQSIGGTGVFSNNATVASKTADMVSLFIQNNGTTGGVTLNVPITVSGTFGITSGVFNTTATNILQVGSTVGTPTAGSVSYTAGASNRVNGPMRRVYAASTTAATSGSTTNLFPVGTATEFAGLYAHATTTASGPVVIQAQAFTPNAGTNGVGVNNLAPVYWEHSIVSGAANVTAMRLGVNHPTIATGKALLQATTAAGAYEAFTGVGFTVAAPIAYANADIPVASVTGFTSFGDLTPCVAPADQPTTLTFPAVASTAIEGSFTAAASAPTGYLVVRYTGAPTPTLPVNGTSYAAAAAALGGTVVYSGPLTTFNATGLTAGTAYEFRIYSFNNSGCFGPTYNTTTPLIASATTCATALAVPVTSAASGETTTSFNANWAASTGASSYLLDVSTNNTFTALVPGYSALSVNGTTQAVTGLTASTTYYYRVRAFDLIGGCYSLQSTTVTAATECPPATAPTVAETFSSYTTTANPTCWKEAAGALGTTVSFTAGTSGWAPQAAFGNGAAGGTAAARINLYSTKNDWLISQPIDLGATPGLYRIKYKMAVTGYLGTAAQTTLGTHKVDIVASLDGGLTWSNANILKTYTGAAAYSNTGQNETVALTGLTGIVKFAFVATTTATSPDIDFHVDDFIVEPVPACLEPSSINFTSIGSDNADATWTASTSNPSGGYEYEVRTSGAAGSGATGLVSTGIVATTSNLFTGLTANTTYNLYLRSVCAGGPSEWTSGAPFTTDCAPNAAWVGEGFATGFTTVTNMNQNCWKSFGTGSAYVTTSYSSTNANSMYLYAGAAANVMTAITPPITNLGTGTKKLKFKVRTFSTGINFEVGYLTSNDNASSFVSSQAFSTTNTSTFQQYEVVFGTAPGAAQFIGFRSTGVGTVGSLYFDDIEWVDLPAVDISTNALVSPAPAGCYTATQQVVVQIKNNGLNTLDFAATNATASCVVTGAGSATLTKTINTGTLAPNATLDVTLDGTLDMSVAGTYTFNANASVPGDANGVNDALPAATRTAIGSIATNYSVNFDAATTLPASWANLETGAFIVAASHGKSGNGLYKNYYASSTTGAIRTLIVNNVLATDNVMFDTRVVDFTSYPTTVPANGWGDLQISVSTDCGATYTTLATYTDINSLTWSYKQASLAAYAGQNIIVRIKANYVAGDWYLDIDNFKIGGCLMGSGISMLSTSSNTLSTMCGDANTSGFTYYGISSGGQNQYCMAINWGTNLASKADAETNNRITMFKNGATGAPVSQGTTGTTGTATLGYYWNVDLTGLTQLTTPVAVRFYYVPADLTAVTTAAATYGTTTAPVWFKTVGSQFSYTSPSNPATGQWVGMQTLTASAPTTDPNGQTYVELSGISTFSGGSVAVAGGVATPLPITMKSLVAIEKGATNLIKWETATEQNVRTFAVEKSIDGKNWKTLGTVVPNTTKRYEMIDAAPATNTYYRVRNIDNDGREDVSEIVSVNRKSGKFAIASIAPNPTTDDMNVKIETTENTTVIINVVDVVGRVVMTQSIEALNGFNTVTLNTSDIQSGTYFLVINDGVSTLTERIVKQ
jgi:Secretion system C-terminal sorting domain